MTENDQAVPKACCIINPRAANNKWIRRKSLRDYLMKHLPGPICGVIGEKQNSIELARQLCLNHEFLVAIGGDGTVSDVLQGIMEARREKIPCLGIVPLGSGNAFRKSLGIPKKIKKAIRVLTEGSAKEIDLIDIEGRAAGFVSIGGTAEVTRKKLEGRIQGLLGHLLAGRILLRCPRKEVQVELFDGIDDNGIPFQRKTLNLKIFDCVVGKTNHFGYSWKIAPKARVDDSFLDITFFEIGGLKYMLFFPLIYFGVYQRRLKHDKAKKMVIQGKDLAVQYNGEFLGLRDRIELQIVPRAVKVICPRKSAPVSSPLSSPSS